MLLPAGPYFLSAFLQKRNPNCLRLLRRKHQSCQSFIDFRFSKTALQQVREQLTYCFPGACFPFLAVSPQTDDQTEKSVPVSGDWIAFGALMPLSFLSGSTSVDFHLNNLTLNYLVRRSSQDAA